MNLDGMPLVKLMMTFMCKGFYQPAIPICSVPIIMCKYFRGVAGNSLLPREMWLQSIFKFMRIHN